MHINWKKFKEFKKSATALVLATTMMVSFAGCSQKEKIEEDIGYMIETENGEEVYPYIINLHELHNEKYHLESTLYPICFARVKDSEEYIIRKSIKGSNKKDSVRELIWPDCFASYSYPEWINAHYFDMNIKVDKIELCNCSNNIEIIYTSITAKNDLTNNIHAYSIGQRPIRKGDNMSSVAIFFEGELSAYKQMGVGSDCENVVNATIGDVDKALCDVKDIFALNEAKQVTPDELEKMEKDLDLIEINKKLILK